MKKLTTHIEQITTMQKVQSLHQKMTTNFIDYCNLNNINLRDWYRWQLHLIWQQRKNARIIAQYNTKKKD